MVGDSLGRALTWWAGPTRTRYTPTHYHLELWLIHRWMDHLAAMEWTYPTVSNKFNRLRLCSQFTSCCFQFSRHNPFDIAFLARQELVWGAFRSYIFTSIGFVHNRSVILKFLETYILVANLSWRRIHLNLALLCVWSFGCELNNLICFHFSSIICFQISVWVCGCNRSQYLCCVCFYNVASLWTVMLNQYVIGFSLAECHFLQI